MLLCSANKNTGIEQELHRFLPKKGQESFVYVFSDSTCIIEVWVNFSLP